MTFEKPAKISDLKCSSLDEAATAARVAISFGLVIRDRSLKLGPGYWSRNFGRSLAATLVLSIMLVGVRGLGFAQDGTFAGVVSEITCRGEIIELGTSTLKDLTPARDTHRPVAAGDRLRCKDQGRIVVQQGPTNKIITKNERWVRIRPSPILNAIVKSSDLAGTRNGPEQPIYSPPSGGAARAGDLVVRWNPWPGIGKITISIWTNESREKLCCSGTFDGTAGSLELPELRNALSKLHDRNPGDRKLMANITGSVLRDFVVIFSVLSSAEEAQLNDDLAAWDGSTELLRHLGRAHVFSHYQLFTQAAEEFQAALAVVPTSPYLLGESINAERRTGNTVRVADLELRLANLNNR